MRRLRRPRAAAALLAGAAALTAAAGATARPLAGPPAAPAADQPPAAGESDVFPHPVHRRTLDNGLRVVAVPFPSPGVVAYFTVVRTGSRQEVEPGHSGFAHFFEHMMFRGTERYPAEVYNDVLKRMGADSNAFTTDDYTLYYIVGPAAELETMMDVESDRFRNLSYGEEAFRTEALAVLGEYNKNVSNPIWPMWEKLRATAFTRHTYRHTTMGFLEDIEAMPGYYDYSLGFFDRFYRPENAVLLVVGDVDPERVIELARRHYGDWEKGYQPAAIPAEPPQTEPREAHLEWPSPTRPQLMVGYHAPAFGGGTETAALDLIDQLLTSESAELYRRLVVDEQWVDQLSSFWDYQRDPGLYTLYARVKSPELMPAVRAAIERAVGELAAAPVDAARLERIKSHLRYGFALDLTSPASVGFQLAEFLELTGEVGSIRELFDAYERVTPGELQRVAGEVFRPANRTVVTLAHGELPEPGDAGSEPAGAGPPAETAAGPAVEVVTLPEPGSPLVAIRLLLATGSIHDPPGKEGLAALTALMVGDAGTERRTYSELIDALYPLAASIGVAFDREVTVVSGVVHRDTLEEYTALLTEAVLTPRFDPADFERNKERLHAYLTTTLRSADDERLGLEALQTALYAGHPYGHPAEGTVEGLAAITLDDVERFYRERYTRTALTVGVAGGYPEGFAERLAATLGALPAGEPGLAPLPAPPAVEGRRFTLIDKATSSVGIHFGYPLPIDRGDPDYYPLMVANSFLGEHRTFHGRLMQQLRGERGLNYGDYSYIEFYADPPGTSQPTPNVPRRQQYFSVWLRPVVPDTAHFALRAALREVDRLVERGLTADEFALARDFLVGYSKLWGQTLSDRLGILLDSRFYGTPNFIDEIERRLGAMTVEEVNRAAKRYLTTDRYRAVLVTDEAAALKARLEAGEPSPMSYNTEVSEAIRAADREIERLPVEPTAIEVVPVEEMFEE